MDATVMIVTKNRRDELRRAVASALTQTADLEVLVIDDGSTDGTAEMLAAEFPTVRVRRSERSQGYIVQRNLGVQLATAPIVITVDDDAAFASPRTVEQTLLDFDEPRVGAVAIPHIDIGFEDAPRLPPAPPHGVLVTSEFVGTACAVRREVFLRIGGFRDSIFHQGEERDFCVRLLGAGYVVRVGRADPIDHFTSPRRDVRRMDLYGRRNTILYAWYNEPLPSALVRMVEMSAQGLASGISVRRPGAAVHGLLLGYRACWEHRRERRPLPRPVIKLFRQLWKRGPLPLSEIEGAVP
jgi:glycosyltransferase involved in cell wall biosynthesis